MELVTVGCGLPGEIERNQTFEKLAGSPAIKEKLIVFANPGMLPIEPELTESMTYWKSQVFTSLNLGATVVVFLDQFEEFLETENEIDDEEELIDEDQKAPEKSSIPHSFAYLPKACPPLIEKNGEKLQLRPHPLFSPLWETIKPYLRYSCTINGSVDFPLALSSPEKKLVSGLLNIGKGHLLLFPEFDWTHPDLFDEDEWTPKALKITQFMIQYFTKLRPELDKLK